MIHVHPGYKQNKNIDFAKAVFENIVSLACKHGKLKCDKCDNVHGNGWRYFRQLSKAKVA